jgi:hypothetical protein
VGGAPRRAGRRAPGPRVDAGARPRDRLASLPAIAARRRDLGFSEREIIEYLESFRYRIGPDDEKAVGEYRRLLALLEG